MLDYLSGANIDWKTFKKDKYKSKHSTDEVTQILREITCEGQKSWNKAAGPGQFLPSWVPPTPQFFQGQNCEYRKKVREELANSEHFIPTGGYHELLNTFELTFVSGERIRPLRTSIPIRIAAAPVAFV